MTEKFMIIHLGNPYDFVIKDIDENNTYGTFSGDEKSMNEFLEYVQYLFDKSESFENENQVLKQFINDVFDLLDKNIREAENMVKWSDEKGLRYTNVSWSFLLKTLKLMKKGMSLEGNLLISDETLE